MLHRCTKKSVVSYLYREKSMGKCICYLLRALLCLCEWSCIPWKNWQAGSYLRGCSQTQRYMYQNKGRRESKLSDPTGNKSLSDCLCHDVGNGNGLGPMCELINARQQDLVKVASFWSFCWWEFAVLLIISLLRVVGGWGHNPVSNRGGSVRRQLQGGNNVIEPDPLIYPWFP